MQAFCAKGRFADFLQTIPVRVALESGTVLLGAAAWAEQCLTA
jgi:glucokinase